MTDYFRAYAHRVASYHPAAQRDEMFAEVYDELCEEFADWQADHPDRGEIEFLQAMRPHPVKFATQLAGANAACLVGPAFYFSFVSALKTAMAVVVGMHLVVAVVSVLGGTSVLNATVNMLTGLPGTLLWVGACVLGVFVALEKSGEQASWLEKWDASKLEPADGQREISRFETAFDLGLSTLLLLWLLEIVRFPAVIRPEDPWAGDWAVNLPDVAWLAAGALLAWDIAFAVYRLGRTFWTPRLRLLTIAGNVPWLALLAYAISVPGLLSVEPDAAGKLLPVAERALKGGLSVVFAIIAWDTLSHAWRLFRSRG